MTSAKPPSSFVEEIKKTGFVLENNIALKLKSAGWTVISNKYYVDDAEETVREIDLIAYKCTVVENFDVYTALIISCKKSEDNAWALLSREINLKDPNSDWSPLHAWSNNKALNYKLSEQGKANQYYERAAELGVTEVLQTPSVEVFAYQEMNKVSKKPQNDKPIFNAITSLMKAQEYELGALPRRKKNLCIYQFNLLSVIDTDLIRLMFSGDNIVSSSIETEHYLARYILKKRETFSRIRFIRATAFEAVLIDYGRLHNANCEWFAEEVEEFYTDVLKDSKRTKVFLDDFKTKIEHHMLAALSWSHYDVKLISINWDESEEQPWIGVVFSGDDVNKLNADEKLTVAVASAFKAVYRYEGKFSFSEDVPF